MTFFFNVFEGFVESTSCDRSHFWDRERWDQACLAQKLGGGEGDEILCL